MDLYFPTHLLVELEQLPFLGFREAADLVVGDRLGVAIDYVPQVGLVL